MRREHQKTDMKRHGRSLFFSLFLFLLVAGLSAGCGAKPAETAKETTSQQAEATPEAEGETSVDSLTKPGHEDALQEWADLFSLN